MFPSLVTKNIFSPTQRGDGENKSFTAIMPNTPSAPRTPITTTMARPFFRGKRTIIPSCICKIVFESGGFKTAHDLNCNSQDGTCYQELNEYNNNEYIALSIRDKKISSGVIPIADLWENTIVEIERQLMFVEKGLAVNIPMVILEYTDKAPEFIKRGSFATKFRAIDGEKSSIISCPENLVRIVLIMERIEPPGPTFDAIGLAKNLVQNGVLSGDFKPANVGIHKPANVSIDGYNPVLIDWDPKFQEDVFNIDTKREEDLVCYMIITFLTQLLAFIIYRCRSDDINSNINLFNNVKEQLYAYHKDIVKYDEYVRVIKSATELFTGTLNGKTKQQRMLSNLNGYNPFRVYTFVNDKIRTPGNIDELYKDVYISFQIIMDVQDDNQQDKIKQMVVGQFMEKYKELSQVADGGSRKRPKTKRRRSHKKKKNTRKMFR